MNPSGGGYAGNTGGDFEATQTPYFDSPVPNPPNNVENEDQKRCPTGVRFITSIPGILNPIILIALIIVIICAGVTNTDNAKLADGLGGYSNVKVSAYNTRNAVLAFAIIGVILILVDTFLYMTTLIKRLTAGFDLVFIIVMLVFSVVLLILGCCAAAAEKKMSDTLGSGIFVRRGSLAAASFFLFVAMIATIVAYVLRLMRFK